MHYTDQTAIVRSIEQLQASDRPAVVRKLSDLQERSMRKEALSLGAQAGLYEQGKKLDAWLRTRAKQLDQTYDFRRLVYPASLHVQSHLTGTSLLPPVVEFSQNFTRIEGPDTLHVARSFYRISQQARFSTVVPNWREYLWQAWPRPNIDAVPRVLLPDNAAERKVWIANVKRGFTLGLRQALTDFHTSLVRLQRDFLGMVLYRKLEMQGRLERQFWPMPPRAMWFPPRAGISGCRPRTCGSPGYRRGIPISIGRTRPGRLLSTGHRPI